MGQVPLFKTADRKEQEEKRLYLQTLYVIIYNIDLNVKRSQEQWKTKELQL